VIDDDDEPIATSGDRKRVRIDATAGQEIVIRVPVWTIQITHPVNNAVILAGDSVPLQCIVRRNGAVQGGIPVTWNVPQGQGYNAGAFTLEPTQTTNYMIDVCITALPFVQAQHLAQAVLPVLDRLELGVQAGAQYNVYCHGTAARNTPLWVRDMGAEPYGYTAPALAVQDDTDACPLPHPACYRLGSRANVRARLTIPAALTRQTPIRLTGDSTTPFPNIGPAAQVGQYGNQFLRFELPAAQLGAGVGMQNLQTPINLESSCQLPFVVGKYDLSGPWQYCVQRESDNAWSVPIALVPVTRLAAYCIFDAPRIGPGLLLDAEFDAFHVEKAALWGTGTWSLKHDAPTSIPFRVTNMVRHYAFPQEYDNMNELRVAHWRTQLAPLTLAHLDADGSLFYPPTSAADPFGGKPTFRAHFTNNSGWALLDNPTHPGGRCNQQAALLVAILRVLGIASSVYIVKSRRAQLPDKGWLLIELHDIPARGSPCYTALRRAPKTWKAWNFHGIVRVDASQGPAIYHEIQPTYYDSSFSTPPAAWPPTSTSWWDGHCKKHGIGAAALRSGRDLKPRGGLIGAISAAYRCFCPHAGADDHSGPHGHAMGATARMCPTCGSPPAAFFTCLNCNGQLFCQDDVQAEAPWIDGQCPHCHALYVGMWCEMIYHDCSNCGRLVGENDAHCYACNQVNP